MITGPFQISFERSGGFAGVSTAIHLHSESLSPQEEKELRELLDRSGFSDVGSDEPSLKVPDQFNYRLTVKTNGDEKIVEFGETALPDRFRPLVQYLSRKMRTAGRK